MAMGKRFLTGLLGAAAMVMATPAMGQAPAPKPKLVVMVAVDQFSTGLYQAWAGRFTGGLKRMVNGVAYANGYQSHAGTETCPGHSTILTGKHPNKTGIVGNLVRDETTGKSVYCLADSAVTLALGGNGVSPAKLNASTVGEWLKAASPQSRVVAISAKDRGAINLAGHTPDGVFWLTPGKGFTTYLKPGETVAAKLAPIAPVNAQIAKVWSTRPSWTYAHADCRALASTWSIGGATFNSTLPPQGWGVKTEPAAISADIVNSPILDDVTLIGARSLIRYYKLGKGPATDLLAVSFSATDYVSHKYGTQGPEMCEQMYRLDATLGKLFADLDALKIPYIVALTADHGGSDFTERLAKRGYDARRVDIAAGLRRVNAVLRAELRLNADPLTGSLEEASVVSEFAGQKAAIAAAAAKLIAADPDVAGAFTLDELLETSVPRGKSPEEFTLKERFALSAYRGRSPDVYAALRPGFTSYAANLSGYIGGHGSPWDYDRRVPILFWWNGAKPENRALAIDTVDIAPTLANVIGVKSPMDLDGKCMPLTTSCP